MSKVDDSVSESVLKYMKSQNRPYSVQNVFDNLRGELAKAKVALAMDAGVESGALVVKAYGAQKIYCSKQESSECSADSSSTDLLKTQVKDSSADLSHAKSQLEALNSELHQYDQYVSACTKQVDLTSKLSELKDRVSAIETCRSDKEHIVAPYSGDELVVQYDTCMREYNRRKRIATEMISVISEQCGMSRTDIIDDLGLEIDPPSPFRGT